jgi:hypothetical protein
MHVAWTSLTACLKVLRAEFESWPLMIGPLRTVHLSRHKWPTLRVRGQGFYISFHAIFGIFPFPSESMMFQEQSGV